MFCQPISSKLVCAWPEGERGVDGGFLTAGAAVVGTYSLQVSAPGHETETTQVELRYSPPDQNQCGLSAYFIDPATVSLIPTDGGTD
jgi:hypothetical protein